MIVQDAMKHICKINRILESPRGNALLIGVGGSGKQSLSRLAAYISSMEVFQITLRKGYGIPDLKTDFQGLYQKTGLKNLGTVFLMSDAQVADERFLVLVPSCDASNIDSETSLHDNRILQGGAKEEALTCNQYRHDVGASFSDSRFCRSNPYSIQDQSRATLPRDT